MESNRAIQLHAFKQLKYNVNIYIYSYVYLFIRLCKYMYIMLYNICLLV